MEDGTLLMRIVYGATVLIAGPVGVLALARPTVAARKLFAGRGEPGPAVRVGGAFWVTLAGLSAVGLWRPRAMALVLVIQLLYKGLWLVVDVLPAVLRGRASELPGVMTVLFTLFVLVLPWAIPWAGVFAGG